MSDTPSAPERVVHLPLGEAITAPKWTTLLKTGGCELLFIALPAGREFARYGAPGEIIVQCIEGHVAFEREGNTHNLHPGDLLHLYAQEVHVLRGIMDSSVLVTHCRPCPSHFAEISPAP